MTPQDCRILETLLDSLLRENQGLLILAQQQRQAIRTANSGLMARLTAQQQAALTRIATLEHDRNVLVKRVSQGMPRQASGAAVTLRQLCQNAPPALRTKLLEIAAAALDTMQRVRDEHQVIGRAAAALAEHMEGLTRQAARAMSGTGIYGQQGLIRASRSSMAAGVDIRM